MEGVKGYIIIIAIIFVFFAVQSVASKRARDERMRKFLDKSFGKRPEREYKYEEYARIRYYFDSMALKNKADIVDDITWNDLSMDNIFMLINHTNSSVGEEYLYNLLRTINFDSEKLKEFDDLSEYFLNNPDKAKKLQYLFMELGRTRSISFFDFIHRFNDVKRKSNLIHNLCMALGFGVIGMFFVNPAIAVATLVVVFSFNIYTYYKEKSDVSNYFVCCKYLEGLTDTAKKIEAVEIPVINRYRQKIKELRGKLKYLEHNMYLISDGSMDGSIASVLLEYIKMLFHVDLIKFNSIVADTVDKLDIIDELYETMGRLEAELAVASFKKLLMDEYGAYAKAEVIRHGSKPFVEFEKLYHPMIENAVKNSMGREHAVLLTGSNASGKSTFLKTVAINGILSQTIGIACGESFKMTEGLIYSSMALRDDLESSESYYIVEIKSLKRILDIAKTGRKPVMCFIDEVLRGTNTVERIAASSVILEKLSMMNTICFAATHDIELTRLMEGSYKNYHFEEEVAKDDVLFNYCLRSGPATTRNAIKLLRVIGYDSQIIKNASVRAEDFLNTGSWR